MKTNVLGVSNLFQRQEIEAFIKFATKTLHAGKQLRDCNLKLMVGMNLSDGSIGWCLPTDWKEKNPRDFEIGISSRLLLMSYEFCETLIHELLHLSQFYFGKAKISEMQTSPIIRKQIQEDAERNTQYWAPIIVQEFSFLK